MNVKQMVLNSRDVSEQIIYSFHLFSGFAARGHGNELAKLLLRTSKNVSPMSLLKEKDGMAKVNMVRFVQSDWDLADVFSDGFLEA